MHALSSLMPRPTRTGSSLTITQRAPSAPSRTTTPQTQPGPFGIRSCRMPSCMMSLLVNEVGCCREARPPLPRRRARVTAACSTSPTCRARQPRLHALAVELECADARLEAAVLRGGDARGVRALPCVHLARRRRRVVRRRRLALRKIRRRVRGVRVQLLAMTEVLQVLGEHLGEAGHAQGGIDLTGFRTHLERLVEVAVVLRERACAHAIGDHTAARVAELATQNYVRERETVKRGALVLDQRGVVHSDTEHAADLLRARLKEAGFAPVLGVKTRLGLATRGERAALLADRMRAPGVDALHQRGADPGEQGLAVLAAAVAAGAEQLGGEVERRGGDR